MDDYLFPDPLLSKADLSKISPLNNDIADKLISVACNYVSRSSLKGNYELFRTDLDVVETSKVNKWLFKKQQRSEQQVLVLFDFSPKAAICTWEIFVKYWDDFCYPSSDDVFIFPMKKNWILFYSHEEMFQYKHCIKV